MRGVGLVGRAVAHFEGRDLTSSSPCHEYHQPPPPPPVLPPAAGGRSLIPQPLRQRNNSQVENSKCPLGGPAREDDELLRMQETEAALRAELRELREHNELLEFRLLEKSTGGSSCDDVSDSGVSEELPLERAERLERMLSLVSPPHSSRGSSSSGGALKLPEEAGLLSPLSMHESGIFDTIMIETENRSTQTEDAASESAVTMAAERLPELRNEIQKLLEFRAKVQYGAEQGTTMGATGATTVQQRLGGNLAGTEQCAAQACADLVRQHERKLQELTARCERLQAENRRLDEERCELEEAENDARHISQRLETHVAALGEERALLREEIRRGAAERASVSRQARRWETLALQLEERNFELEEADVETRHHLGTLEEAVPAIAAFAFAAGHKMSSRRMESVSQGTSTSAAIPALPPSRTSQGVQTDEIATTTETSEEEREELRAQVAAYAETLRLADELWSQTEREHLAKLQGAEAALGRLRDRVGQLEELVARLKAEGGAEALRMLEKKNDSLQRSERRLAQQIHELEANELALRDALRTTEASAHSRERRFNLETKRLREEAEEARAATAEMQRGAEQAAVQLLTTRRRAETLRKEVEEKQAALVQTQMALAEEEKSSRAQRRRAASMLAEAECTNSELREEVDTLEASVLRLRGQLEAQRQAGERAILRLNLQLSARESELNELRRELEAAGSQEAGLAALAHRTSVAAHHLQGCSRCGVTVQPEIREISTQLRALADIISGDLTSGQNHRHQAVQGRHRAGLHHDEEAEEGVPAPVHTSTTTTTVTTQWRIPPLPHPSSTTNPPLTVPPPAGARVRAAQLALLRANKPTIVPCPPPRPAELVAR